MRYITKLDNEIIKELERIVKEDKHYKSRYRAQAIILSHQGIYELEGRGRKPLLTIENDAKKVKDYIKKTQYK